MINMIMGNLDGNMERISFYINDVLHVIKRNEVNLVFLNDEKRYFLEKDNSVWTIQNMTEGDDIRPYFILLNNGIAYNSKDYQILFNVKELQNNLVSGVDVSGRQHLCRPYDVSDEDVKKDDVDLNIDEIGERIESGNLSRDDTESLKDMIQKMKDGEFFELLTMEFSGKIKEVAKELIDFRKDIQERIEPDIVEIAARDIPEASNQLEGINDTLEDSTMKIMDINEEQMEIAGKQIKTLEKMISGNGNGRSEINNLEEALKVLDQQILYFKEIESCSLKMMEPLSFQDLVGQRIQRIIKLVRSMELKIEELIVSFGIKLRKYKEDPNKTYEDLNREVDIFLTELKGPQREGQGLDQAGIDDILSSL